MARLKGKVAIITGGASGMGLATVKLFAAEGASVFLADIRDKEGQEAARETGNGVRFVNLDVTSEESWRAVVAEVTKYADGIDILINNAGIGLAFTIEEETRASFEQVMAVNCLGAVLGTKAVLSSMERRGRGSIVNISSTEGFWGTGGFGAYVASKWAIRGYTKSSAIELGHREIRVNSVHPGLTNTPMPNPEGISSEEMSALPHWASRLQRQPIPRVGEPIEVAYVSLFLASDEASYVTGAEIAVDGGMTVGADEDVMRRLQ